MFNRSGRGCLITTTANNSNNFKVFKARDWRGKMQQGVIVILHPPGPVCSTREALIQIPCSDPLPSSKTTVLGRHLSATGTLTPQLIQITEAKDNCSRRDGCSSSDMLILYFWIDLVVFPNHYPQNIPSRVNKTGIDIFGPPQEIVSHVSHDSNFI